MKGEDTIVALSTPQGIGGIHVIRISGSNAFEQVARIFTGKHPAECKGHTLHFGNIENDGELIDEVLVGVFRKPRSFTKEDMCEISCHGSPLIARRIIGALTESGARLAEAGEFTQRAYMNGRFDLAQAEAVADLIHAETDRAQKAALNQMRGGISNKLKELREELINFASLVELELDFSEEDVEFAERDRLRTLVEKLRGEVSTLMDSFALGSAIKNGIATVIAGKPNAGKSTLLNVLLQEERAIVSDIPGTTRDVIEDQIVLEGVLFRFIDTAGLRETEDIIESMGVQRSREQMEKAGLIIYLFDLSQTAPGEVAQESADLKDLGIPVVRIGNKVDSANEEMRRYCEAQGILTISATSGENVEKLKEAILEKTAAGEAQSGDILVTSLRHYESLKKTREDLDRVLNAMEQGMPGDLLAQDIRQALFHLGEITGEITTDDLLGNIFSKFCIGK